VKPAVYLTALMQPERYTTATMLADTPLHMRAGDGRNWSPENYDRQFRGQVLLFDALVHSYNVPTVRLGLDVGPERVVETLRKLGVQGELKAYPALMLGAADLSLMDVTRCIRRWPRVASVHRYGRYARCWMSRARRCRVIRCR